MVKKIVIVDYSISVLLDIPKEIKQVSQLTDEQKSFVLEEAERTITHSPPKPKIRRMLEEWCETPFTGRNDDGGNPLSKLLPDIKNILDNLENLGAIADETLTKITKRIKENSEGENNGGQIS